MNVLSLRNVVDSFFLLLFRLPPADDELCVRRNTHTLVEITAVQILHVCWVVVEAKL